MVHSKADLERRMAAKRIQLHHRRHLCLCQGRQVAPTTEASIALEGLGAQGLVDKIRQGEITAEEVMYTYITRARVLGHLEVREREEEEEDEHILGVLSPHRGVRKIGGYIEVSLPPVAVLKWSDQRGHGGDVR